MLINGIIHITDIIKEEELQKRYMWIVLHYLIPTQIGYAVKKMMKKNRIERGKAFQTARNTNKDRRGCNIAASSVGHEVKGDTISCPYDSFKMVLKKGEELNDTSYKDSEFFVCTKPGCDCRCRTTMNFGKRVLVSTPANKRLRLMRNEAHHYLDAVLNLNLFAYDKENALSLTYKMINEKVGFSAGEIKHIGDCREYDCKRFVDACIEILYSNKSRIKNFTEWKHPKLLTEETESMVKEIVLSVAK